MTDDPEILARTLVDQHYAAGPDQMKSVLAKVFAELSPQAPQDGDPRERLLEEASRLEKTSLRGSE